MPPASRPRTPRQHAWSARREEEGLLAAVIGWIVPTLTSVLALATLLPLTTGCASDRVDQLVAQLEEPHRREQAIEGLLAAVRNTPPGRREQIQTRVIHALGEAYRSDHGRGQIVAAMAMLRDPRAEEVFIAAMRDADRGGPYLEAAMRAARMLGALNLRSAVPPLVEMLQRTQTARADRAAGLQRALIEALEGLGDQRAVPALLTVLNADPAAHDVELSRMAARALGSLGAAAAIPSLIAILGATDRGLLVYEAARQALCAIGDDTLAPLRATATRRDKRGRLPPLATAAARVIGDLADARRPLSFDVRPKDPHEYRLAAAEALLRRGASVDAIGWLVAVLRDRAAPLHERQRAAELLGWYGDAAARGPLREILLRAEVTPLLRWAVVLAFARAAPEDAQATLTSALDGAGAAAAHHLAAVQPRLELVATCAEEAACYAALISRATTAPRSRQLRATAAKRSVSADDTADAGPARRSAPATAPASTRGSGWRALELAVLKLGRLLPTSPVTAAPLPQGAPAAPAARTRTASQPAEPPRRSPEGRAPESVRSRREKYARDLARLFARVHPQVKQAALVCLERWAVALDHPTEVARLLEHGLQSPKRWQAAEAIESRAFCLVQRLRRSGSAKTPAKPDAKPPAKEAR